MFFDPFTELAFLIFPQRLALNRPSPEGGKAKPVAWEVGAQLASRAGGKKGNELKVNELVRNESTAVHTNRDTERTPTSM
uniref:Uncharacterized protein n=1 Tax=Globodera rostochiensis TaxID=31243 RepID=A0A914H7R1_GLORO